MSKQIKIVHISSAHRDGDVRIFHKECVSLANAGYDVTMVIPNTKSRLEKGVNIVSVEVEKSSRFWRAFHTVNLVYKVALALDGTIYHLHDPELLRIAKKLKRKGKIVIYDAHEDLPRQVLAKSYVPKLLRKTLSTFLERYENSKVRKVDGVIAATPFIRDRFLKINTNTIDINNFPILQEFVLANGQSDFKERVICYIGSISEVRGVYELVQALPEANCKLILAGAFDNESFKQKVENSEGWKHVQYLGYVDRKKVSEILSESSVGIVTLYPAINYLDALPVKMFEYMAAGIPVLASDFPLWKKIIVDTGCGLCVNPLSSKEIAKGISEIMSNHSLMISMSEKGKSAVREKYNWDVEKEKLINFYAHLINSK